MSDDDQSPCGCTPETSTDLLVERIAEWSDALSQGFCCPETAATQLSMLRVLSEVFEERFALRSGLSLEEARGRVNEAARQVRAAVRISPREGEA